MLFLRSGDIESLIARNRFGVLALYWLSRLMLRDLLLAALIFAVIFVALLISS